MTDHLANLEATLGTCEFDAAFKAIKALTAAELASIASRFVSHTPAAAPKRESLHRIYQRHASLIDSAQSRNMQGSRSAA